MSVDPFAALGLVPSFDVDVEAVEKTHRDLSRALHPDRFASSGAAERRMALAKAVEVNEAWRVVRDPIRRAEALLARAGVGAVGVEGSERRETKPSPAFLMDMMEQREALAEAKAARDMTRVAALALAIEGRAQAAERALSEGFRAGADASLVQKLGELRFYRRFLEEVSAIEDAIEDGLAHGAA